MKRALGIFLALLVLCFVLPADAETARDDAETLRNALQDEYGITILMGKECADYTLEGHEFRIVTPGYTPFLRMTAGNKRFTELLEIMDESFAAYPPDFFSRFMTKKYPENMRFLLVDEITGKKGMPFDGVQTMGNKRYDIIIARTGNSCALIHHEIWHAMEIRIGLGKPGDFRTWKSLNPGGFKYTKNYASESGNSAEEEPKDWFVREYSKTFETEDRATVFEAIMTKDEAWWSSRPHLQKKAKYLRRRYEPVFGEIGGAGSY